MAQAALPGIWFWTPGAKIGCLAGIWPGWAPTKLAGVVLAFVRCILRSDMYCSFWIVPWLLACKLILGFVCCIWYQNTDKYRFLSIYYLLTLILFWSCVYYVRSNAIYGRLAPFYNGFGSGRSPAQCPSKGAKHPMKNRLRPWLLSELELFSYGRSHDWYGSEARRGRSRTGCCSAAVGLGFVFKILKKKQRKTPDGQITLIPSKFLCYTSFE